MVQPYQIGKYHNVSRFQQKFSAQLRKKQEASLDYPERIQCETTRAGKFLTYLQKFNAKVVEVPYSTPDLLIITVVRA